MDDIQLTFVADLSSTSVGSPLGPSKPARTRHRVSTAVETRQWRRSKGEHSADDWSVITKEDWALIRRLAAEGVPEAATPGESGCRGQR